MTKTMKKIPVALLVAVIAMAFAFAIGTVTAQEAHADTLPSWATDAGLTDSDATWYESESTLKLSRYANVRLTHTLRTPSGTRINLNGNGIYKTGGFSGTALIEALGNLRLTGGGAIYGAVDYDPDKIAKVTFDTNGGSAIHPQYVLKGNAVNLAENTSRKENYAFAGWYDGDTLCEDPFTTSSDVTLTAHWRDRSTAEIIFNPNDIIGAPIIMEAEEDGTLASLPEPDAWKGFTFMGWYPNENLSGEKITTSTAFDSDSTVYAAWAYNIATYDDLKAFASIVNGGELNAWAILTDDIYCTDKEWIPIGDRGHSICFVGHFDGNHKVIYGLSNEDTEDTGAGKSGQGLFGEIMSHDYYGKGEVKNVGLVGGKIIGEEFVGGVAGKNSGGTMTNCYNTGTVSGTSSEVGGVAGDNDGTMTNCYNTGAVTGPVSGEHTGVGGVAGKNNGTIGNCYNTGTVIGNGVVGGVAGLNYGGTMTNCYNTGAVSGTWDTVGGVAAYNYGTINNSYNTGAVSGTGEYVGGVVGTNFSGKEVTNCYNAGAVSGSGDTVGSVAGRNLGTIDYCYYNKELNVVKAIGSGTAGTNVMGLETSQMIGTAALNNMAFSYESPSENPWLTKEAGKDADSRTYYEYYPHLNGFAYDISKKAADWPGKLTTRAEWSDDAVSYDYNGSAQGPKVTKVISSPKPVEIPDDMTAEWRKKIVEDVDNPEWGEPIYVEPSLPGVYKLTIKNPKDGDKVIEEIVYIILKKKNSSNSNDYNVKYQVQKKTAGGGTKWSDIDSKDIVDVGNYKAVIELTGRPDLEEKEFQIKPAPLTITAKDQTLTYNGQTQGEGDTAYEDAAQIAEKVTVKGLQGSDELTKIEVDGQGKEVGEYVLRPNDAAVGTATDNYDITYVNGTLTITKMSITPSVSIEGWVYGSAENKPVVTGNAGGGKETFLYKKTDEPDSAYTETVPTDAGEYTVKAKIAETANYKAGEATVDFTISPADMEVTAGDYQGTYDGAGHGITVNAPEGATVEYSSDGGESWTGEKPVFTEAGTHNTDFRVSLANYKEYTGSRQVIILQAAITIKADDKSSKYGEALKKLTYKVSGAYVKGDDLGIKLSTAAKKNKAGTTAIKVSWNGDPNYEAKLVNGKYTVKKENTKPSGPTKAEKKAAKIALDAGVVARSSGNKVTASWGAVRGASSYVIYANYCDQKNCMKLKTVSGKTTSIDITKVNGKKFNPNKNLKFYVVAYKTVKGKKVKLATSITAHAPGSKNSKRTNVTGVKVKKASFKLKKGKTAKIKAKLVLQKKSRKPLKHEAKFRYATSNTKVAKVNKKGKITAVGKGKCTVYVYAVSGVSKKIKVTVK